MKLTELVKQDLAVEAAFLTVSVDSAEDSRSLVAELDGDSTTFPIRLLEDRGHRVIDRYGLRNASSRAGIPHPSTFVIDREGVVRWRFVERDYTRRAANEDIMAALRARPTDHPVIP